jgi:membrane protein DedA with SNARE-associated domain
MIDPHFQNHLREIGFLVNSIKGGSYVGIFLLSIIIAYLIPLSETMVLILFGYVAGTANLNLAYVILLSISGGIIGDNIIYRLSFFGNKYIERFNQKMRQHKLIQYEHLVADNIGKTIYFLRLITGVRFFGPVISGTLGVRWKKFFFHDCGATFLHATFFVWLGYRYHHKIIVLLAETEIIKSILLFSSVFIVGLLVSVFSKKINE